MNIYEALISDHRQLQPMLDRLVSASERDAKTQHILDEIRDALIPHSRAEEAVFYNSLRSIDATKDLVKDSYKEHMEAEMILRTLRGLEHINLEWTTAAKKLRTALNHHILEEETKVFDAAKQVLLDEEAEQLGKAFLQVKRKAAAQGDLKNTADLVANLLPQRFAGTPLSQVNRHPS